MVPIIQEIATATLVKSKKTFPISWSSRIFRFKPPSYKITATERETKGNIKWPKSSSGFSQPVKGPAKIPATNNKRIEGRRKRHAIH
jgi:hypothetical protein